LIQRSKVYAALSQAVERFNALDEYGVFAYLEEFQTHTGRPRPMPPPDVHPFQTGSASHGDFTRTILAPQESGVGAIGIYFVEGRLGLLYYPMKSDEAQPFSNVSVTGFKDAVRSRHGFSLDGFVMGAEGGPDGAT
jgi:hypothetical protein